MDPYGHPAPPPRAQKPQKTPEEQQAGRQARRQLGTVTAALIAALVVIVYILQQQHGGGSTPAAASAATTAPPCTTTSCIITDLDKDMVGMTARDGLVFTRAACKQSTEKSFGHGIYSAICTVTYSDGSTATGTGTLDMTANQVSFSPALS